MGVLARAGRRSLALLLVLFLPLMIPLPLLASEEEAFDFVHGRNRLFQLERQKGRLLHDAPTMGADEREARTASLDGKIRELRAHLAAGHDAADLEFARSLDAMREHGRGWPLEVLSRGEFTGRNGEAHKPLPPVYLPAYRKELESKIFKKGLGYPLLILLSYDPACREAYRLFMPRIEEVVRTMEGRIGEPYRYFDPRTTPNEDGWDLDAFWAHAHAVGLEVAMRYLWDGDAQELRHGANFLGLVCVAGLINQIILETDGDGDELYRRTLWRKNAIPWLECDTSHLPNKFDTHHFMSHAWLVYLQLLRANYWEKGRLLSSRAPQGTSRMEFLGATYMSHLMGLGYEVKSMKEGCGFKEKTAVAHLPRPLRKVAQALGLESIRGYEAFKDMGINEAGARFGAALYLSGHPLAPSDEELHREVLGRWFSPRFLR